MFKPSSVFTLENWDVIGMFTNFVRRPAIVRTIQLAKTVFNKIEEYTGTSTLITVHQPNL